MSSTLAASLRSPWHEGELALQRSAGVVERMDGPGRRFVRDYLLDQHRQFYPLLPFIVAGSVDAEGDAWATVLAGKPGFLQAPTPAMLDVNAARDPDDPADAGFGDGAAIGLLGIDLATRRRNRLNGVIRRDSDAAFGVEVVQSYGNCPQYIQLRDFESVRDPAVRTSTAPERLDRLSARAAHMIANADTFFVASYADRENGERQVDVSHRGGKPGFVRLAQDGVLTIPDFAGNLFFNTLGNILANGKAGLLFADFETGDLLQLSGDAEVILDSPEIAAFQGAERLWRFTPRRIVYRADALPLRWHADVAGQSSNSLLTGNWDETAERLKAAALARAWRPFRVAKMFDESDAIRSFYLEPADGAGIVAHAAGQHLPIRVTPAEGGPPAIRTYTLSVAPSDGFYRISVKRQGRVSAHLHDTLRAGGIVEARAPAGDFTIDASETRPAVLLAAGVGVTPMLAMLRHLVYEGERKRRVRPVWLFHAARSLTERAFADEIRGLAERAGGAVRVIRSLTDTEGAREGADYDIEGRIDIDMLKGILPFDDYDFYLCGPAAFMQSIYDGLRSLNVADGRIHAEAFGPSGLVRKRDEGASKAPARLPATESVPVAFVKSSKEARWTPAAGTLLELAEARGLAPEFSCRGGSCGTCRTRVVEGEVAYPVAPSFQVGDDEALICCAVPAASHAGPLVLDL
ncbi:2Fe-2S iron-sulfur cluster-binding protein [Caballeronia telluris]|uniref:Oxidoreductase FAD/NAD(P)-binding subunit n=1 Tax=Caballeronia telluris TaxID=326475 RepID=A0A158ERQ3_9BURK|nr:pyridoxamine 5'-phosphate oxidase family protein [Caballeronia telluris]SAL09340.1 oxidoreductase FAD/NAD(P)-binding subunit [Caballeronia telluris]